MNGIIKNIKIIFVLAFMFFIIFGIYFNPFALARERTEDLSNLINYPEIYTNIQELKAAHPNWTFTMLYTGLNWNDVITGETTALHTRSLVHNSLVFGNVLDWVCATCKTDPKDNGSWYCASPKAVSYYMDTRNWLNDSYIFSFETLSFNSNAHSVEGVQAIISGTFMDKSTITYIDTNGNTQTINKSYAQIIYDAGKMYNVSPYHLAARIRQEQGSGTSSLISGKKEGFVGYYNYFNVGAGGNSEAEIITNGLTYAKNKGWTTPELAIQGGASFLKGSYIGNFQDTLYLQKYSVDSSSGSLYGHQYQQNISAPYTEGLDVYDAYEELGILESNFNFIVPIYENMPASASTKPGRTTVLTTENVVVQTLYTPLRIRVRPSISSNVLAEAPRATVLVRIEKANEADENGYYWDTVAYNNGTKTVIGYASREYLGEIATAETLNEAKTIGVMCNLRNGPGTSNSWVKKILPVGTQVTVIDKINYKIDGLVWCRVKLSDGTQGYVAENFFQAGPVEKYKIDGENIIIAPNTAITDIPKATLVGDVLGTGAKVKVEDKEYTLVVLGDVNGDGDVDVIDLALVKRHLMQAQILREQYFKAGILQKDGTEIDIIDLALLKRFLMGTSIISL